MSLELLTDEPSEFVINNSEVSEEAKALFTAFRDHALCAYLERTPYAGESMQALKSDGAKILNDHVALRTFKDQNHIGGKSVLEKLFLAFGYKRENNIAIDALHLKCTWYEPPQSTSWPKVFISEQQVERLPKDAQEIIFRTIGNYYQDEPLADMGLDDPEQVSPDMLVNILEHPPWNPTYSDYERILEIAEEHPEHKKALQFSAWTMVHGHRWNHLTILQNSLSMQGIANLEELNHYLRQKGFPMNESGGQEVQGSAEVHLKQSSTIANIIEHTFSDGITKEVPGSFVEYIERFKVDGKPFRGFLAANAQGIFSSTDAKKR